MLAGEDVAPEQARQRGAEGDAEGAVVHAERHGVDRRPLRPVAERVHALLGVDGLPRLDDARKQDCGAYVCTRELGSGNDVGVSLGSSQVFHAGKEQKGGDREIERETHIA